MKVRIAILFCLFSFTGATTCTITAAGIPPAMFLLKNSYETNLQIIIKSDVNADCLIAYGKKLDSMIDALKKTGDLDGVIAARAEKKRLDEEKTVPTESAQDVNPAIAKARTEYQQLVGRAEIEKSKRILALADNYAINLESLKRQLTQQDKIDDATLVKLEIERLRTSADVTSAQFVLADHSSKLPQPAATQPIKPATVITTLATAPAVSVAPKLSRYQRRIDCDGGSTSGWTKTTQYIKKGDVVTISAKGSWKCTGLDSSCGPEGYPGGGVGVATKTHPVIVRNNHGKGSHVEQRVKETYYGQNRRLQNEPYGALLCRIGESGEVRVAGNSVTFTSEEEGLLYMDSNVAHGQSARGECSGEIAVTVEVVKKQP